MFMAAQFSRIRTWAMLWVGNKLLALIDVWRQGCSNCNTLDRCGYCVQAQHLIYEYMRAVENEEKLNFHLSIFGTIRNFGYFLQR